MFLAFKKFIKNFVNNLYPACASIRFKKFKNQNCIFF